MRNSLVAPAFAFARALACCMLISLPAHAYAQVSEYELKAAFLFNFALFTQPTAIAAKSGAADPAPYRICIYGKDPFGAAAKALNMRMIDGRPIVVKAVYAVEELKSCQLVFIGDVERDAARRAANAVSGLPIITVVESKDFLAAGAIFNLLLVDDKVAFQVNTHAARGQQLEVSAKLTRLAKSVR